MLIVSNPTYYIAFAVNYDPFTLDLWTIPLSVIIENEFDADISFALLVCLSTYWFHNWSQKTQAHIDMWIDSHHQYSYRHFDMD